jgi:hypothetical protein
MGSRARLLAIRYSLFAIRLTSLTKAQRENLTPDEKKMVRKLAAVLKGKSK